MTIKINVGVNKKKGLPDYGSIGALCTVELEADNSILDDADQLIQRVKDAYESARKAVESELAHHNSGNGTSQSNREPPQQRQEYRNDNRNDNSASGYGIASAKQQQFIASLLKGVRGLDWRGLDRYCDKKFGKSCSQLSPKEASSLIDDLRAAKEGRGGLSA